MKPACAVRTRSEVVANPVEWDEAISAWATFKKLIGGHPEPLVRLYKEQGIRAWLKARLDYDLKRWERRHVGAAWIAARYAGLGEADSAFEWLDRAYQERDPETLAVVNMNPTFDPIRADPRFAELAARIRIPIVEPDGPLAAPLPDPIARWH